MYVQQDFKEDFDLRKKTQKVVNKLTRLEPWEWFTDGYQ